MTRYQLHVLGCAVCRAHVKLPCSNGYALFQEGTKMLVALQLRDPGRARA